MFSTATVKREPGHAGGGRLVGAVALVAALALGACGGAASPAASTGPGASSSPGSSQAATTSPTQAPGTSTGPSGAGGENGGTAFQAATTALNALDSYAFKVEIQSTSVTGSVATSQHQVMTGVVENKPDKATSLFQSDLDASGNVTTGTGIITIADKAWISNGGPDGPWTEVPAAQADIFVQSLATFRPEQMFGLYFAGIGGDFTVAGTDTKNGVATTHYTGDQSVGTLLGAIANIQGTWSSDVWIANDGGYLVHSEASATSAAGAEGGSFKILVDITDPNTAGPVQSPPPA